MPLLAFLDIESNDAGTSIRDIGIIRSDGAVFHEAHPAAAKAFLADASYIIGHNIVQHDSQVLQQLGHWNPAWNERLIDTLLLSALLYPNKLYHSLLKDDKLQSDERNNPVLDAQKSRELFDLEVQHFRGLDANFQAILQALLHQAPGFAGFFHYLDRHEPLSPTETHERIRQLFALHICDQAPIESWIVNEPVELALALALIQCQDRYTITAPWVLHQYPRVETLVMQLRALPCADGCSYCQTNHNPVQALQRYFGYAGFRKFGNQSLQQNAVKAAVQGKSILVLFPTGGGKSITFQVPALMDGEASKALTVVISPLQSLMKDQVDNLEKKDILQAVTINGSLDPIERSKAFERVENGTATLLYITPESLRSRRIEALILKRHIARIVIDEAHCFSAWGHDFRVDYLYIAEFIKQIQAKRNRSIPIPVSCFTATAKPQVVEEIQAYFRQQLNLELELFRADVSRENLHYQVIKKDSEEEKFAELRRLIQVHHCPTIVYVSRTKRAYTLAEKLSQDGFDAKPYHGKMEKEERAANQDAFMNGKVSIMVATSAFGMGVDKSDVGLVVHYEIANSLENYIQEAGRAGRDQQLQANCYVLFDPEDLDKHFVLLNQTKLNSKEINQVWKAIKEMTKLRKSVSNSALEIARRAGWDDSVDDMETRVKTAIAALEDSGYVKRGQNMPQVFATSILTKTAQEAIDRIHASPRFSSADKESAVRIIRKLFSSKSKRAALEEVAESRVDYISDQLGMLTEKVIRIIQLLREEKILDDTRDLTAFINTSESDSRTYIAAETMIRIEEFIHKQLRAGISSYALKSWVEVGEENKIRQISIQRIKSILHFWVIKRWIKLRYEDAAKNHIHLEPLISLAELHNEIEERKTLANTIIQLLHRKSRQQNAKEDAKGLKLVEFSVLEIIAFAKQNSMLFGKAPTIDDVETALYFLTKIDAIKIEGGFLVTLNKLKLERTTDNLRLQYKESDYEKLNTYYQQRTEQIHIVGEYANRMVQNYNDALRFVDDYFTLSYSSFLNKYFPGSRQHDIKKTMTKEKFRKLFGELSPEQLAIINDQKNPYILVAAGPGSGKTKVVVHKMASLIQMEDVKREQLLMLTFSRAAATEFKSRLIALIGNAAHFIDIKTFHSFCFDLLGRNGSLTDSKEIIKLAVERIRSNEIEAAKITRTVLLVDEAQDMDAHSYALVEALIDKNEEIRVILVGDDDQNIYDFRQADSQFMASLLKREKSVQYELVQNYRSLPRLVDVANRWIAQLPNRLKRTPNFSKKAGDAQLHVFEYPTDNFLAAFCNRIVAGEHRGNVGVLTEINEEAAVISGILRRHGLPTELIQTNESFKVGDLFELHAFTALLNRSGDVTVVSDENWKLARTTWLHRVERSKKQQLALRVIDTFFQNNRAHYISDWKEFIQQSKLEDFTRLDGNTIFVSTIHKSKGKEFEQVYILSRRNTCSDEESKRKLYVAMTRAKSSLEIHYANQYLKPFVDDSDYTLITERQRNVISELDVYLTHEDVFLDYFKRRQSAIQQLFPGDQLRLDEYGLSTPAGISVLRYSKSFQEKITQYQQRGYRIQEATINFRLFWWDKVDQRNYEILLPMVVFRRD